MSELPTKMVIWKENRALNIFFYLFHFLVYGECGFLTYTHEWK
jgi:hypothetical protein